MGESNILQEVWYPDPRCFNDSAVDVKRICLHIEKARYKIEKKNIYYFQNLFQPKIPIAQSHASEASGSVQLEFGKYYWRKQLSVCLLLTLCMSWIFLVTSFYSSYRKVRSAMQKLHTVIAGSFLDERKFTLQRQIGEAYAMERQRRIGETYADNKRYRQLLPDTLVNKGSLCSVMVPGPPLTRYS